MERAERRSLFGTPAEPLQLPVVELNLHLLALDTKSNVIGQVQAESRRVCERRLLRGSSACRKGVPLVRRAEKPPKAPQRARKSRPAGGALRRYPTESEDSSAEIATKSRPAARLLPQLGHALGVTHHERCRVESDHFVAAGNDESIQG